MTDDYEYEKYNPDFNNIYLQDYYQEFLNSDPTKKIKKNNDSRQKYLHNYFKNNKEKIDHNRKEKQAKINLLKIKKSDEEIKEKKKLYQKQYYQNNKKEIVKKPLTQKKEELKIYNKEYYNKTKWIN